MKEQMLLRKLELLEEHRVRDSAMAEILEVDLTELQKLKVTSWMVKNKKYQHYVGLVRDSYGNTQTLQWNHAFEFLTDRASQAEVTLELRSITSLGEETYLGSYAFAVSELFPNPACTARTVQLPGTNISLKLHQQLRFLGNPAGTREPQPPWEILGEPWGNLRGTLEESLGNLGGPLAKPWVNQTGGSGTSIVVASEKPARGGILSSFWRTLGNVWTFATPFVSRNNLTQNNYIDSNTAAGATPRQHNQIQSVNNLTQNNYIDSNTAAGATPR